MVVTFCSHAFVYAFGFTGLSTWTVINFSLDYSMMDSDRSSSSFPAGKIRTCLRGKRMSSTKYDFHTVCVVCRGLDCDMTVSCIECTDVSGDKMSRYLAHKVSLKSKLKSRQKQKALSQSASTDVAPATAAVATAEVTVASGVTSPVAVTTVSALTSDSNKEVISHVESLCLIS